MSRGTTTSFVLVFISVFIGDILCGDVTNTHQKPSIPWQTQYNSQPQKSTTPWPALGYQPRKQLTQPNNPNQQPKWTLPNGSTNWVRNTPAVNNPSQNLNRNNPNSNPNLRNPGINYNTDFINREKGGNTIQNNRMTAGNHNPAQPVMNTGSTIQNSRMTAGNPNSAQPVLNPNPNNVVSSPVTPNNRQTNNNQGTINRPPSPSYANIVGNKGNQIAQVPKTTNNVGLPIGPPTGSTLNSKDTAQNGPSVASSSDSGDVEDFELREFSEELYNKDTNNLNRYVTLKLQGMTTSRSSRDEAPEPLLTVSSDVYTLPSVAKLMSLYNNYILETNENEVYTAQEKLEENDLLDTILATPVMQHTRNFLIKKGKLGKDPKEFKDLLRLIWFQMYSRGGGRIGSSGFEHVFLTEVKNNQVSGLHNWLYFNEEEKKRNANYLGYMKKLDLGNKGAILKLHFTFRNIDKPVGSMFVGTSPEVEIALYSTCFLLRADKICPLKMNGNRFIIRTYTYRYRGKNMIGSAFPEI